MPFRFALRQLIITSNDQSIIAHKGFTGNDEPYNVISQTQSECRKYVGMDIVCQYMQIFFKLKLDWAFSRNIEIKRYVYHDIYNGKFSTYTQ